MSKNKNSTSPYMKAGIKNKSKPGKKLDLNKIDIPILSVAIETAIDKPKPKSKLGKRTKKKRKAFWSDADSLWSCDTVEKVEGWLFTGNSTFQKLALKSAMRKNLPSDLWSALEALVTAKGATSEPILLDPGIQLSAFHQQYESLVAVSRVSADIEFAHVIIIDGQFETSDHHTVLDIYKMKGSGRRILSKMASNYFGVIELALFNSHKHPSGGRLVSPHFHAIIWGQDVLVKARAVAKELNKTITPNSTGAKPVVVDWVDPDPVNLARMAAYLVKSHDKCKTFYPGKDGKAGNTHHSRKADRPIRYLRLAEIRSMLTFRDVTFGSGEGLSLRSGIAKTLTLLAQEQARKAGRRLHPDEIPSFWASLKVSMGTTRFNLPIIKRTK
jgi:hypothetical protein